MLKFIFLTLFFFNFLFSGTLQNNLWSKGETLITFLNKHNISKDIYFNLSKTDKELCSEIVAGVEYQTFTDNNGALLHTLIPISEEMQIYINQDLNNSYQLDIIPIVFEAKEEMLVFPLESSPYEDILAHTKNKKLANEFIRIFRKSINFRRLHKNDMIAIKYTQKIRMGKYFGRPVIHGVYVKMKYQKDKYVFSNDADGRYYDEKGRSLTSVFFKVPLRYSRISSKFTYKRFHPILKRYRAHLGVDFAAPTGRKIWSTADGKVVHKGRKGGYGHTVIVKHPNGYKSLYAHMSKYSSRIKVGSRVKQGQLVGYVGTSGRSTGPHLHFGLYKNGRAVDPLKVMRYSKKVLSGKEKKQYLALIKPLKEELTKLNVTENNLKIEKFDLTVPLNNKSASVNLTNSSI
ncbi:MAG TPA: M23 family metallopeptidase [Flavobacteriia bacterium]|nr:M23 family metallopeptidase [Flavobacteriia bacterium]